LVGELEGKRPLERPSHRWEDNIRMDVRDNGDKLWTGFVWIRIGTRKTKDSRDEIHETYNGLQFIGP
jgi:hypothetical protein